MCEAWREERKVTTELAGLIVSSDIEKSNSTRQTSGHFKQMFCLYLLCYSTYNTLNLIENCRFKFWIYIMVSALNSLRIQIAESLSTTFQNADLTRKCDIFKLQLGLTDPDRPSHQYECNDWKLFPVYRFTLLRPARAGHRH